MIPPQGLIRGLQGRLAMLLAATLIAVSTVLLGVVLVTQYRRVADMHDRAASDLSLVLESTLENAMLKRDLPGLTAILADLGRQPQLARVMVLNPGGIVRFSSDPATIGDVIALDPGATDLATDAAPRRLNPPMPGLIRALKPVRNRPECRDCHGDAGDSPVNGLLVVDYATGNMLAQTLRNAAGLIGLGALATGAALLSLWIGLRRIVLAPLDRLVGGHRLLAGGALNTRLPETGGAELAELAASFNAMAGNLAAQRDALRRAHDMQQALIDAVPDGIRLIGPDFIIRAANRAYARQVGQPLDAIIGTPCHASSHGRDTPCPHTLVTCPVARLRAGHLDQRDTFRDIHRNPDGASLAVEVSAAPMPGDDGAACVVEAIRDLDDALRISHQQRLSEIGLLATGVAHEINNPLNSVQLALSVLSREAGAGRLERMGDYAEIARREIARCIEITDVLLKISAPAGAPALLNLAAVADEVLTLLGYQADSMGVRTSSDIAPDLRLLIADADLRMVLVNLVINALHAMPGGGTLALSASRLDGRIVLEVADSGVGIRAEDLDQIFLPFWSRRSGREKGRGLGLSIVKSIMDKVGGTIDLRSAPGQGTTFSLRFPDPDASADRKDD